jgi:hypothetical protein
VPPPILQEAHDGERAHAEVDAAVGVDEVELRAGHDDEGLLGGGQRRCGVLFRLREEVLGELVGVDGGVQQGRGGGGRGGEEGGVEVRGEEDGHEAGEGGRGMGDHRRVAWSSGDQSKEVTPAAKPGNVRRRWKGKNSLWNADERQIWTTLPTATARSLPSGLKRMAEGAPLKETRWRTARRWRLA